jgi:protein ImuA
MVPSPSVAPAAPANGRLHEIHATLENGPCAAAAALLMLKDCRPLVWLRTAAVERRCGRPSGHGLAALGIDPGHLLLAVLPDELALLKAGADALRSGAAGGVLLELHGKAPRLDLTASRRLALAAGASKAVGLVLRVAAEPVPSAAFTRWSVASAPSRPFEPRAPGHPAFAFELIRHRAGPAGGRWHLEWAPGWRPLSTPDQDRPHAPALPCPPVPVPLRRPAAVVRTG